MEGWREVPILDVCDAYQPKTIGKKEMDPSGPFPVYGANGVIGRYHSYNHEESEVLLGCRGTCGVVNISEPRSWITGNAMVVRPKGQDLHPELLRYFLEGAANFDGVITGAAQPQITRKSLSQLTIRFPVTLPEQERIVAILDEAFAAIATATANAEKNLANARELFESYLDSFFRSPKDSWNSLLLDAVLDRITYGFTNPMPTTETGPWMVTAKNIRDGGIDYANARHTSQEAYDELLTDKSRPKVGDLLLTKDGTLGRLAVVDRNDICVNQSVAVLQKNEQVNSSFLQYLLTSPNYQELMIKDAGGTTIKHIYITRVVKMSVSLPPMKEQRALVHSFERYQAKASVLTAACQHKLELLNNLKQSLLHKAFTGELTADSKAADRSLSEANV